MARFAILLGDRVVGAAEAPDGWTDPDGRETVAHASASPGWVRSDGVLLSPDDALTDAQRAARIVLPRARFFLAVDAALDLDPATDGYADQYLQAVVEADASAQTPLLTAEQRAIAVTLIRTATQFSRADASQALLEAIGGMVGLSPSALDTLFLGAAG